MPKRAKLKDRTIYTPTAHDLAIAQDGDKLVYWKQILPKSKIYYTEKDGTTREINFDDEYLNDVVSSFANKAIDQTCFQIADSKNRHGRDFDPERQRATVLDMATLEALPESVRSKLGPDAKPGLYAKMQFFSKKAARAVRENPGLGVSARVRENFTRADGTFVKRAVIHVLGTIDPRVTGMSGWQAADLSYDPEDGYVLDLSEAHYEGNAMAKGQGKAKASTATVPTDAEIDAMTEAELDAYLESQGIDPQAILSGDEGGKHEADEDDDDEDDDNDGGDDTDDDSGDDAGQQQQGEQARETTGASLSNKQKTRGGKTALDLANERAEQATARANQALARQAASEFKAYRSSLIADGVPPAEIDLAAPVLSRADEMVVDLSNSDEDDVNVTSIVRKLLEARKGTIDMSNEAGHSGTVDLSGGDDDPDKDLLDAWETQIPSGR